MKKSVFAVGVFCIVTLTASNVFAGGMVSKLSKYCKGEKCKQEGPSETEMTSISTTDHDEESGPLLPTTRQRRGVTASESKTDCNIDGHTIINLRAAGQNMLVPEFKNAELKKLEKDMIDLDQKISTYERERLDHDANVRTTKGLQSAESTKENGNPKKYNTDLGVYQRQYDDANKSLELFRKQGNDLIKRAREIDKLLANCMKYLMWPDHGNRNRLLSLINTYEPRFNEQKDLESATPASH